MLNKFITFTLLIIALIIGCTTKDGNIIGAQQDKGTVSISIKNTSENARIFVNGINTNQETPENISLYPGRYIFKVYLPGYISKPDSQVIFVEEKQLTEISYEMSATESGNIIVNSSPEHALLKIDGLYFGITPLTVNGLKTGNHIIKIIKSGYKTISQEVTLINNQQVTINRDLVRNSAFRTPVLEHFSNYACDPCVEIDEKLEEILQGADSIEIASIGYHPDFPSANDPFYITAREENDARKEHYNINETPQIFLDGVKVEYYGNPDYFDIVIRQMINERLIVEPQLAVLDVWIEESFASITGKVKIESLTDSLSENLKLRIALVEKEIHLPLPGPNGVSDFKDIMRDFYPNTEGVSIALNEGEGQTIDFSFNVQSNWTGGLQVVAFLQKGDNGEIIEGAKSLVYRE